VNLAASWRVQGRPLVADEADGQALVLDEPLSFWGGVSAETGEIIDRHHPQVGRVVRGRVLVMPSGRGSSSSSSVLAECLVAGTGPTAIVLLQPDPILMLGAMVAAELGGPACPIIVCDGETYARIRTGDHVEVGPEGQMVVTPRG
jgi:predicted aconitase with swiveling domain